jgi:hypothetical protein
MGKVIQMGGRQLSKTALWIAQAIEREVNGHPDPIRLIVTDDARKTDVKRQLQCMVGMRYTRIEVLTYADVMQEKMEARLASLAQGNQPPPNL